MTNMLMMIEGHKYRLTQDFSAFPKGTEFIYQGSGAYLDWFVSLIEVDGELRQVPYGVNRFCKEVK